MLMRVHELLTKCSNRRLWAGYGTGSPCYLCELTITRDQIEYELESTAGETFRVHYLCFSEHLLARGPELVAFSTD